MTMNGDAIVKRMKAFREACERSGIKLTHQRMEIYRTVISTEEHPDADWVYRRVKKRIPTISLDTVYRNLKLLGEHGVISVVGMSHENVRFDGRIQPHHHFVCTKCGMIRDFVSGQVDGLAMPEEAKVLGTPLSLHLEVKGICSRCQEGFEKA